MLKHETKMPVIIEIFVSSTLTAGEQRVEKKFATETFFSEPMIQSQTSYFII